MPASGTAAAHEVKRAQILFGSAAVSIAELQRQFGFSRPMIHRCVDKALGRGVQMGLKDRYHRPHEAEALIVCREVSIHRGKAVHDARPNRVDTGSAEK